MKSPITQKILKNPKELFMIVAFWLALGVLLFLLIDYLRS